METLARFVKTCDTALSKKKSKHLHQLNNSTIALYKDGHHFTIFRAKVNVMWHVKIFHQIHRYFP